MATMQTEPKQDDNTRPGSVAASAPPAARPRRRPLFAFGTRLFNPLILRFAGRRHVGLYAVLEHRGRRSGRVYTTPVAVRRIPDGFLVPMAFGQGADWFRNVQAAGGCMLRWRGLVYHVVDPQILDMAAALPAFSRFQRLVAPLFARQFVRLRLAPAA
jgi:deazaflavin-dependent oxidoreductase (nitroreductase family)